MNLNQPTMPSPPEEVAVDMSNESGLPLPPSNPDLVKLFRLSDEERRWALTLKAAVESSEELENLADLQYVQFALANHGDLHKMLERVQGLQDFRHEYNIHNTLEDGMSVITAFTKAHPYCLLSVAFDDVTENYGMVYDRTRIRFDHVSTEEEWRTFLGCPYYLFTMLCPDPHSMRNGIFLIGENDGFQRSQFSFDKIRTAWDHFLAHFPVFFRSIKFFHTNVVANLAYSMLKPFMRRDITDRIVVGCQFGANISSLYLMPDPDMAVYRALGRMDMFLTTRYQNEAKFSLSASPSDPLNLQATNQGT
jgi:hypothetical protein